MKRHKEIVAIKECRKRKRFAKTVANILRSNFWTNGVSFSFDEVSFTYKYNT